ncbi:MAG: sugar phosphate isomerase/epimerase [Nanoarchaeota archaeon]|nr:sugar phosphate isomerase/epimerase [Nanoarchaeota archaeon]MBU1270172.1 sugar phosphate isomerase/epimerase [Nanoarchaeota archaeon]MBU1604342.1 sugar phosphate isomerase/epimerase [Nanoarchaeota archaeon]MBU2443491.1 sugar phosphate isomerase/epimerase [Nanoarchaeota archaeon]
MTDLFTLGAPINPNSKANGLFPANYVQSNNFLLNKFMLNLAGGDLEIHLQESSELPRNEQEFELFADLVRLARTNNVDLMGHIPFIEPHNPKNRQPFKFDFSWFVVPSEYTSGELSLPAGIGIREQPKEVAYRSIELFHKLEVDTMTVHVTKPGLFLNENDWTKYQSYIEDLLRYTELNSKGVKIAVETGGVEPERLIGLHKNYGVFINVDTAHAFLDFQKLNLELSDYDINKKVVEFAERTRDFTAVYHFTQTTNNIDAHWGLFDKDGVLTCNEEIIRIAKEERNRGLHPVHCMVESNLHIKNFLHVDDVLKNVKAVKKEYNYLTLFIGLPGVGKSEALENILVYEDDSKPDGKPIQILEPEFFGHIIRSNKFRDVKKKNKDSLIESPETELIPKNVRESEIYENNIHKLLERDLKQKENVTVDATYNIKEIRNKLFDIIKDNSPTEVYIFHLTCNNDDLLAQRFDERKKISDNNKVTGTYHIDDIRNIEVYKKMKAESPGFSHKELKNLKNVHIIEYDTEKQRIKLYNPDAKSKGLAYVLKSASEKKYDVEVKIVKRFLTL